MFRNRVYLTFANQLHPRLVIFISQTSGLGVKVNLLLQQLLLSKLQIELKFCSLQREQNPYGYRWSNKYYVVYSTY